MRIGVDASRTATSQRTGTENYSLEMIKALLCLHDASGAQGRNRSFVLYFNTPPEEELFAGFRDCQTKFIPFPRLWTHVRLSLEMLVDRPDVLFVPAHVIPVVHPKQSVVTIHDMGHLYYPESYTKSALRYLTWATKHNISSASRIIADSESTKRDIAKRFPEAEAKTMVVYPGISRAFAPVTDPDTLKEIRSKYGIPGEYFLYVGTIHPRKNLERLILAYGSFLKRSRGTKPRLVLAGKKGWLPEGIMRRLHEIEGEVTITGFVPDADLPALYSGATAVAIPSLFEGFGMPLVEAMACGTPVMTSNSSSMPEIVGEAGLLVDPLDVEEMAEAMFWLWSRPALREELRERGLKRAADFTWEEAAERALAILEGQPVQ